MGVGDRIARSRKQATRRRSGDAQPALEQTPPSARAIRRTPGVPKAAYLALSILPVIGFRNRRRGILAGLSMFVLGVLLEGGQHFSPGRSVELGDVIANGIGVSCGALLGLPFRTLIAIL